MMEASDINPTAKGYAIVSLIPFTPYYLNIGHTGLEYYDVHATNLYAGNIYATTIHGLNTYTGPTGLSVTGPTGIAGATGPTGPVPTLSYGSFSSQSTQYFEQSTATPLTYDTTNNAQSISYHSNSKIAVSQTGVYKISSRLQCSRISGTSTYIDFWFQKDGSNIANSASRHFIENDQSILLDTIIPLSANSYIEIVGQTPASSNNMCILSIPFQTSPVSVPAIPSITTIISQVL